ncbi:hypothetical protein DFH09DRAFT_1196865, partial [Mycena vulgaris]
MTIPRVQHKDNPFEGAIAYDDGIFDADGDQVMFSVGEIPDDNSSTDVWTEMENLAYCDHTVFADMTPTMAELFDKTADCTVSEAVRAMAAMGEHHSRLNGATLNA